MFRLSHIINPDKNLLYKKKKTNKQTQAISNATVTQGIRPPLTHKPKPPIITGDSTWKIKENVKAGEDKIVLV